MTIGVILFLILVLVLAVCVIIILIQKNKLKRTKELEQSVKEYGIKNKKLGTALEEIKTLEVEANETRRKINPSTVGDILDSVLSNKSNG